MRSDDLAIATELDREAQVESAHVDGPPRGPLVPVISDWVHGVAHSVISVTPVYPFDRPVQVSQYCDEVITGCGHVYYSPRPYGRPNRHVTLGTPSCPRC